LSKSTPVLWCSHVRRGVTVVRRHAVAVRVTVRRLDRSLSVVREGPWKANTGLDFVESVLPLARHDARKARTKERRVVLGLTTTHHKRGDQSAEHAQSCECDEEPKPASGLSWSRQGFDASARILCWFGRV